MYIFTSIFRLSFFYLQFIVSSILHLCCCLISLIYLSVFVQLEKDLFWSKFAEYSFVLIDRITKRVLYIFLYLSFAMLYVDFMVSFWLQNDDMGARDDVVRWADGFVLVYSVTCRKTFDVLADVRRKVEDMKKASHVPVILLGNKSDLAQFRQVTQDEGKADHRKTRFVQSDLFYCRVCEVRLKDSQRPGSIKCSNWKS